MTDCDSVGACAVWSVCLHGNCPSGPSLLAMPHVEERRANAAWNLQVCESMFFSMPLARPSVPPEQCSSVHSYSKHLSCHTTLGYLLCERLKRV